MSKKLSTCPHMGKKSTARLHTGEAIQSKSNDCATALAWTNGLTKMHVLIVVRRCMPPSISWTLAGSQQLTDTATYLCLCRRRSGLGGSSWARGCHAAPGALAARHKAAKVRRQAAARAAPPVHPIGMLARALGTRQAPRRSPALRRCRGAPALRNPRARAAAAARSTAAAAHQGYA